MNKGIIDSVAKVIQSANQDPELEKRLNGWLVELSNGQEALENRDLVFSRIETLLSVVDAPSSENE
jgi:hypothetical protein